MAIFGRSYTYPIITKNPGAVLYGPVPFEATITVPPPVQYKPPAVILKWIGDPNAAPVVIPPTAQPLVQTRQPPLPSTKTLQWMGDPVAGVFSTPPPLIEVTQPPLPRPAILQWLGGVDVIVAAATPTPLVQVTQPPLTRAQLIVQAIQPTPDGPTPSPLVLTRQPPLPSIKILQWVGDPVAGVASTPPPLTLTMQPPLPRAQLIVQAVQPTPDGPTPSPLVQVMQPPLPRTQLVLQWLGGVDVVPAVATPPPLLVTVPAPPTRTKTLQWIGDPNSALAAGAPVPFSLLVSNVVQPARLPFVLAQQTVVSYARARAYTVQRRRDHPFLPLPQTIIRRGANSTTTPGVTPHIGLPSTLAISTIHANTLSLNVHADSLSLNVHANTVALAVNSNTMILGVHRNTATLNVNSNTATLNTHSTVNTLNLLDLS